MLENIALQIAYRIKTPNISSFVSVFGGQLIQVRLIHGQAYIWEGLGHFPLSVVLFRATLHTKIVS